MGYTINSKFYVSNEYYQDVYNALLKLYREDNHIGYDDNNPVMNIEELFKYWGWEITLDKDNNITNIYFDGKLGCESDSLKVIASFVNTGSYIDIVGEDGTKYSYLFVYGRCIEQE